MPEGDTIYRAAKTLQAALAGRVVTRFETALAQLARVDVAGRTIESVRAEGKNLFIDFSGDLHLHTHMRMHGTWHIYRTGEKWRKRRTSMRCVIETDEWVAVAFDVPVADFYDTRSLERHEGLRGLGPDVLSDTFDEGEAVRRIRERGDDEAGDVLLDQRVVAGIGNELKAEILFASRVNPFTRVRDLTDEQLASIVRNARRQMRASVVRGGREKVVYARSGKPCYRCGTRIEFARQGRDARVTYWCPKCQSV